MTPEDYRIPPSHASVKPRGDFDVHWGGEERGYRAGCEERLVKLLCLEIQPSRGARI